MLLVHPTHWETPNWPARRLAFPQGSSSSGNLAFTIWLPFPLIYHLPLRYGPSSHFSLTRANTASLGLSSCLLSSFLPFTTGTSLFCSLSPPSTLAWALNHSLRLTALSVVQMTPQVKGKGRLAFCSEVSITRNLFHQPLKVHENAQKLLWQSYQSPVSTLTFCCLQVPICYLKTQTKIPP